MSTQRKLKVFLIEDAVKIRSILIEIFQRTNDIEVVGFAESEKDALVQLRAKEWDVAIVDVGLREGNGLGVLTGLHNDRKNGGKTYGKRFVFSNNSTVVLRDRILALGADECFDKSLDMDVLVSRIQSMAH